MFGAFLAFGGISWHLTSSRKDSKTVSIVSLGCFHSSAKVQGAAVHFFLDSEDEDDNESDEDEDEVGSLVMCLALALTSLPDS